jgi:hypothetical protein
MIGTGLSANAKSPKRAATKAVENGGRLDVIQSASARIGVLRKSDMFLRGADLLQRPAETVRRFVIHHSFFVVYHTRRFLANHLPDLSVCFALDSCVQFLCLFSFRCVVIRAEF